MTRHAPRTFGTAWLALLLPTAALGQPPGGVPQGAHPPYSHDGSLFATTPFGEAVVFETATGKQLHRVRPGERVRAVAFSPDNKTFATGGASDHVQLWSVASGERLLPPLKGHQGHVRAVAFSPVGGLVASGGDDGTVRLWATDDGKLLRVLRGHVGPVLELTFAPSGRLLASTGQDQTVRVWEVVTGQAIYQLAKLAKHTHMAFSEDGRALLTAAPWDGTIRLWEAGTGRLAGTHSLQRLEVVPADVTVPVGERVELRVRAHWQGGGVQDVTRWAVAEVVNPAEASSGPAGGVHGLRAGRTAVVARYLGRAAVATVTVVDRKADLSGLGRVNFVDDLLIAQWKKAGTPPGTPLPDGQFLRRAHLHLLGNIPTVAEARRFHASRDPQKRRKLIDELLSRPESAEHFAEHWSRLLGVGESKLPREAKRAFETWLRKALADNQPAERILRAVLLAEGHAADNPAVCFLAAGATPEGQASTVAQVFLGVNLDCAGCHPHPYEAAWNRDAHLRLTACFVKVTLSRKEPSVRTEGKAVLRHPETGKVVPASVPGQEPFGDAEQADPRAALARWLDGPGRLVVARNLVNRYWAHFYGRGLIEPVDSLHAGNPAPHAALLDALARDVVEHRFDLKRLVRTLCAARAYELTAPRATLPERAPFVEVPFFAHRYPSAVSLDVQRRIRARACGLEKEALAELGWRPARHYTGPFIQHRRHDNPEEQCRRDTLWPDPSPLGFLHDGTEKLVAHPRGRVARLVASGAKDDEVIEELFLAAYSRLPTADEARRIREYQAQRPKGQARELFLHDVLWALLNTREFLGPP